MLLPVLPTSALLTGVFAPSSDQNWLTIGSISGGVVHFAFTANTGAARTAYITVLGQQIAVTQAAAISTQLTFVQGPSNTPAGLAVTPAITVQLADAGGSPTTYADVIVDLDVYSGANLVKKLTATTNAQGLATFNNLVLTLTGQYTLEAQSSGLTKAVSDRKSTRLNSSHRL